MGRIGKFSFFFLLLVASGFSLRAHHSSAPSTVDGPSILLLEICLDDSACVDLMEDTLLVNRRGARFIAISLNIALGLFGLHRVFLGTDVIVPIFYTFTLGGGGVLWLADLVMLICKRDYSQFTDNPRLIMFFRSEKR